LPREVGVVALETEMTVGNTKIRIYDDCVKNPEEAAESMKRLGKLLGGEVYFEKEATAQ
jgi:hypothetical protein